jgi:hypothetical protein
MSKINVKNVHQSDTDLTIKIGGFSVSLSLFLYKINNKLPVVVWTGGVVAIHKA